MTNGSNKTNERINVPMISLAYDWIHENLYFNANNSIYMTGPIKVNKDKFINFKLVNNVFEIRSLLVSPMHNSIFWLDVSYGTIETCQLDGSKRRILIRDLSNVKSLSIGFEINLTIM